MSVNNVYFIHEIPTTFHRRKKKYNYKLKSQNVNLDFINIYRELIKFNFRYISAILIFVSSRKASYFCFQSASGEGLRINEEIIVLDNSAKLIFNSFFDLSLLLLATTMQDIAEAIVKQARTLPGDTGVALKCNGAVITKVKVTGGFGFQVTDTTYKIWDTYATLLFPMAAVHAAVLSFLTATVRMGEY